MILPAIRLENGRIKSLKMPGKIRELYDGLKKKNLSGPWHRPIRDGPLTHTELQKPHPHYDCKKEIALVHNGIIENCDDLKRRLQKKGHKFLSDTDTEVLPHLIEEYYNGNLEEAVRKALKDAQGSYAIAVIHRSEPGKLVGARNGSPLIVGLGEGENFLASDCPAIMDRTRKVIFVDDKEVITLTDRTVSITDLDGRKAHKKATNIDWDISQAEKGGFAHFMLKEIYEQPKVIHKMLAARMDITKCKVRLDGIGLTLKEIKEFDNIMISACGTAYHAGLVGEYLIEKFAGIPVEVDVSSELRYRDPVYSRKTLFIAVSQSGETADTLAALRDARKKGVKAVSICNVVGSTIVRESDGVIYTHAGPEIGVASTKAYTAQVAIFILLALYIGAAKGRIGRKQLKKILSEFEQVPGHMDDILDGASAIKKCAEKYYMLPCFMYIGRGVNYPNAFEGALKLKEISYIHAEGYGAGEMKHGPIALIEKNMAVVAITPQSHTYDKMISNIQEIRARDGKVIAIATEGDISVRKHVTDVLYIPKTEEALSPLLTVLPLQLLAYYIAVYRGRDVDQRGTSLNR
jgi:glucosamine--fructose-6-phosphate aminotransferase (isomerizing)